MTKNSLLRNLLVTRYFKPNKEEQGISLLLALIMGLVLITGVTGLVMRQMMTRKLSSSETHQQMAEAAASNGFNRIVSELNNDRPDEYRGYLYALENRCTNESFDHPSDCPQDAASDHYYWQSPGSQVIPTTNGELCINSASGLPAHPDAGADLIWPIYTVPLSTEAEPTTLRDDGKTGDLGAIQTYYRLRRYNPNLEDDGSGKAEVWVEGIVKRVNAEDEEGENYLARTLLKRTLSLKTSPSELGVLAAHHFDLGAAKINGSGLIVAHLETSAGFPNDCDPNQLLTTVNGNDSNQDDLGSLIWPVVDKEMPDDYLFEGDNTEDREPMTQRLTRIWSFDDSKKGASGCEDSVACTSAFANGSPKIPEQVEITGSWGGDSSDTTGGNNSSNDSGTSGNNGGGGSSSNQTGNGGASDNNAGDNKVDGKDEKYWASQGLATPPAGFSPIDYVRPTDSQLSDKRRQERTNRAKYFAKFTPKQKQSKREWCERKLVDKNGHMINYPDKNNAIQKCADYGMWTGKNPTILTVTINGKTQTIKTNHQISPDDYIKRMEKYKSARDLELYDFNRKEHPYRNPAKWREQKCPDLAGTGSNEKDGTVNRGLQGMGPNNNRRIICEELAYGGPSNTDTWEEGSSNTSADNGTSNGNNTNSENSGGSETEPAKQAEDWVVKISKDDICSDDGDVCHLYVENINLKNTKVFIENDERPVVIHLQKPDRNTFGDEANSGVFKLTGNSTFCGVDQGQENCNNKPERFIVTSHDGNEPTTACDQSSESDHLELSLAGDNMPAAWITLPKGMLKLTADTTMRGVYWGHSFCSQGHALTLNTGEEDESVIKAADDLWNLSQETIIKGYGRSIIRGVRANTFDIFSMW